MTEFLLSLGWDTADVYLTYGLGWGIQKNHFKTVCVLEGDWSISPWHIVLLQKNKNTNKNEQKNLHQIYKLRVQSSALVFYLPWKASSSAMQQPVIMLGVFFYRIGWNSHFASSASTWSWISRLFYVSILMYRFPV